MRLIALTLFLLPVESFPLSNKLSSFSEPQKTLQVKKISSNDFYEPFHGHDEEHLESVLLPALRDSCQCLIWCAGDSSLDNKYWITESSSAPVGSAYEQILDPPVMKQDVSYWLNQIAIDRGLLLEKKKEQEGSKKWQFSAINTAIEATTLKERAHDLFGLWPQDELIRDNISENDILIVSIGANDVVESLPRTFHSGAPSFLEKLESIFGWQTQQYIEELVAKTKPAKILVCMIYFPDETETASWANDALEVLKYNSNPEELQSLIRTIYSKVTSAIQIDGCEVVAVPLFQVLDGKTSSDYTERVEPSSSGGRKMAEYLLNIIEGASSMDCIPET